MTTKRCLRCQWDAAPDHAKVTLAMGCAVGAFMSCEQAAGNFRYLLYLVPCVLVECAGLACLHTLGTMLGWLTVTVVVQVVIVLAVVVRRHRGGGAWTRDG